jgi:hypothetical protein
MPILQRMIGKKWGGDLENVERNWVGVRTLHGRSRSFYKTFATPLLLGRVARKNAAFAATLQRLLYHAYIFKRVKHYAAYST